MPGTSLAPCPLTLRHLILTHCPLTPFPQPLTPHSNPLTPKVSKREYAWDKRMVDEMRRAAPRVARLPWERTCTYRYLLNLDGNAAASRLASLFHTG